MSIRSLLILLSAVVAVTPSGATAQQYECHVVKPGETVALIAARLTGTVDTVHSSWLRVIDTSRSTVVSRREYDRIRPGWQVCMETWLLRTGPSSGGKPAERAVGRPVARDYRWWAVPAFQAALLIWFFVKRYCDRRSRTLEHMRQFADIFIREFEQPLIQKRSTDPPIRSQVQCMPRNRRLKIFLAPSAGRSYPNLSDHRKNVEYDVARVLRSLPDGAFCSDPLYSRGSWVVIPFQLESGVKEEGGT